MLNGILTYAVALILRIISLVSVPMRGLYFGLLSNPTPVVPEIQEESSNSFASQFEPSDPSMGIFVLDSAPVIIRGVES